MRKKTFQALREGAKVGPYDEMPMLPDDKQVQVHLSKNDRPQPFYLICGKDTLLSLVSGAATVEFKGTAVDHFALTPGSFVYVPAGAPHRIVPAETSVMMRYKQMDAGLEGVGLVLRQLRCGNPSRGMGYRDDSVASEIRGGDLPFCRRRIAANVPPMRFGPSGAGSGRLSLVRSGSRSRQSPAAGRPCQPEHGAWHDTRRHSFAFGHNK